MTQRQADNGGEAVTGLADQWLGPEAAQDPSSILPVALQRPAHAKIENYLRDLIAHGAGRDEPLPTDRALAEEFEVSRMTVRQAYQRLVSAGIVVRYPSRGSFVAPRIVEDFTEMARGNLRRWSAQGLDMEVRVLRYELRPTSEELAATFGTRLGSPLTYLERLRLINGLPVTWDQRYLAQDIVTLISRGEIESTSLTRLLPRYGIPVERNEHLIMVRPAEEHEVQHLGIQPGDTVLARETLLFAVGRRLILSGVSIYPAGRISFRHVTESPLLGAE